MVKLEKVWKVPGKSLCSLNRPWQHSLDLQRCVRTNRWDQNGDVWSLSTASVFGRKPKTAYQDKHLTPAVQHCFGLVLQPQGQRTLQTSVNWSNTFKQNSSTAMWEPDKVMQKTITSSYCPLKVVLQPTESWCLLSFLQDYIKSFFFTWLYLLWLREATNNKQEMTCSRKSEQKLMKRSSVTLLYSK